MRARRRPAAVFLRARRVVFLSLIRSCRGDVRRAIPADAADEQWRSAFCAICGSPPDFR